MKFNQVLPALGLLLSSTALSAQTAGTADSTFGVNGVRNLPGAGGAGAVRVTHDDHILIGQYKSSIANKVVVSHLDTNGAFVFNDTITVNGLTNMSVTGIYEGASHDVFVTGYGTSATNGWDAFVAKRNEAGGPVTSFGTNGATTLDIGGQYNTGGKVVELANGNVVASGTLYDFNANTTTAYLYALNSNGQLKIGYGVGGVKQFPMAPGLTNAGTSIINDLAARNNTVYYTGEKISYDTHTAFTGAVDTVGAPVAGFHGDTTSYQNGQAIQFTSTGDMVIAGLVDGQNKVVVSKYNPTYGTKDISFATGGNYIIGEGGGGNLPQANGVTTYMAVDDSDKINVVSNITPVSDTAGFVSIDAATGAVNAKMAPFHHKQDTLTSFKVQSLGIQHMGTHKNKMILGANLSMNINGPFTATATRFNVETVKPNDTDTTTAVYNISPIEEKATLYPNPVVGNEDVHVQLPKGHAMEKDEMTVYDLNGKEISKQVVETDATGTATFKANAASKGLYFIKVADPKGHSNVMKFQVQ